MLNAEWDNAVLETFELRKHLDIVKKQLVHAMYQQDAATRVISRLIKERDEARKALANTQQRLSDFKTKLDTNGDVDIPEESFKKEFEVNEYGHEKESCGIYPELIEKMDEISKSLFSERKNKKKPEDYYSSTDFATFTEKGSFPLHSSSAPGVLSLDIHRTYTSLICTGGNDGKAVIFDKSSQKVISSFVNEQDHSGVFAVEFSKSGVLLTRNNGVAEYWNTDFSTESCNLKRKVFGVAGIVAKVHPLDPYLIFSSTNNLWGYFNMETGSKLAQIELENNEELSCVTIHPDGLMMATGSNNGIIRLWDIRTQSVVAKLEEHKDPIRNLKFSEKAIHLVSTSQNDISPLLWNLKKFNQSSPQRILHTKCGQVNLVEFDQYCSYIITYHKTILSHFPRR